MDATNQAQDRLTHIISALRGNRFLAIGRAGLDLYADPPGSETQTAGRFSSALGGSSANIAVAIARQGGQAALLSAVSDDAVGRYVINQLQHYSVDTHHVRVLAGQVRTSLAVVETRLENCQSVIYRNGAADLQLTAADIAAADFSAFDAVVVTGTCLAAEPSRSAVFAAIERARSVRMPVVLDLDYRPYTWPSPTDAGEICLAAARQCDLIVGNEEEFATLADGENTGEDLARDLAQTRPVIFKRGENGSTTHVGARTIETAVYPVKALKPTGSGDAFLGNLLSALAAGCDLQESLRRGSAAAAIVVSLVGCAPAMPNRLQLETFMKQRETGHAHPAP